MTVHLVGSGPGDPDLLTVRAARLLRNAEVVVHDRLAEPVLALASPTAARFDVGKHRGDSAYQAEINTLLIELGRTGLEVVRLKGGDPFVFGRGGEEALALSAAGVDWQVVPGVSSAISAPAAAGIPVTHRGVADAVTIVTGHRSKGHRTDWEALAATGATLVVLMGASERAEIARRLVAGGLAPSTPVAAVHDATLPTQRTVHTTLDGLADTSLASPVTLVIGPVAALDLTMTGTMTTVGA
jgi:uroporphyrin-III C-methyltransferase